jgi:hypothetical protein
MYVNTISARVAPRHGASAVAASSRVILTRAWRCHAQGPRGDLLSATGDSRARRTPENIANAPAILAASACSLATHRNPRSVCIERLSEVLFPLVPGIGSSKPSTEPKGRKSYWQLRLHALPLCLRMSLSHHRGHLSGPSFLSTQACRAVEGPPCQPNSIELTDAKLPRHLSLSAQ